MTEPMLTPGPWEVDENGNVVAPEQVEDGHPVVVAEIYERPDARLIAAAPDLLYALEGLLDYVGRENPEAGAARAAIDKVSGKDGSVHAVKEMQQGKFGAPEHHLLQLGTQALILRNNPKAVPIQPERFELLHAGKDAFGYLSWDLTDAWISRAEEWIRSLNDFWKAGTLPPCTCSGWKRLYCSYPEYQGEKVIGCCDPALAAAA